MCIRRSQQLSGARAGINVIGMYGSPSPLSLPALSSAVSNTESAPTNEKLNLWICKVFLITPIVSEQGDDDGEDVDE